MMQSDATTHVAGRHLGVPARSGAPRGRGTLVRRRPAGFDRPSRLDRRRRLRTRERRAGSDLPHQDPRVRGPGLVPEGDRDTAAVGRQERPAVPGAVLVGDRAVGGRGAGGVSRQPPHPARLRPHPLGAARCPPPDPAGGQHAARRAETVPQPRLHRAHPDGVERGDRQDRAVLPGSGAPRRRPGVSERGRAQHPGRLEDRQRRRRDRGGDSALQRQAQGLTRGNPGHRAAVVRGGGNRSAGGRDRAGPGQRRAVVGRVLPQPVRVGGDPGEHRTGGFERPAPGSPSGCARWGRGGPSSCSTGASCSCAAPTTAATRR